MDTNAATDLIIDDQDMSSLFTDLDKAAMRFQRRYKRLSRLEFLLFLVSSVVTIPNLRYDDIDVSLILASVAFALAIMTQVYLSLSNFESRWQQSRSGAEEIKSLCWRFMMRAQPFDSVRGRTRQDNINLFNRIATRAYTRARGKRSRNITLDAQATGSVLIQVHDQSLAEREALYKSRRYQDQLWWYTIKSRSLDRRVMRSDLVAVIVQTLALGGLIAYAIGAFGSSLYSIAAALGALNASWAQIEQLRQTRRDYRQREENLRLAHELLTQMDEPNWSTAVPEIEEALTGIPSVKFTLYAREDVTGAPLPN